MTQMLTRSISLSEFLKQPETEPASEYINGRIVAKTMPQGEHSRLQYKLCFAINGVAEAQKIACAFPELRCTFGERSIVPDIAVYYWERIPRTEKGRIGNRFENYPDWIMEILSPEQNLSQLLEKLIHCSQEGTALGWLINPQEEVIFCMNENQKIEMCKENSMLPVLEKIDLALTAQDVFNWLML